MAYTGKTYAVGQDYPQEARGEETEHLYPFCYRGEGIHKTFYFRSRDDANLFQMENEGFTLSPMRLSVRWVRENFRQVTRAGVEYLELIVN